MLIAIDYDMTWTADRVLWEDFVTLAEARGHEIVVVTWRRTPPVVVLKQRIICCAYRPKREVLKEQGLNPAIWIDDLPLSIDTGYTPEENP